jgi:hypothetical protein
MDAQIATVRTALENAEMAASVHDVAASVVAPYQAAASWIPFIGDDVAEAVGDLVGGTQSAAIVHNTKQARDNFDDWSTTRVKWVERGTGSEGLNYTLTMWQDQGKALLSQLGDADLAGIFKTTTAGIEVATATHNVDAAAQAVEDAADAAKRAVTEPFSFSTKLILWGTFGAVVLGVGGYAVRSVT